ncbi:MAG TPA: DMP19 family protein [Kofleriaceae bacterium]|nr:DMP19 family protein [Kofleriaceae bacterium]
MSVAEMQFVLREHWLRVSGELDNGFHRMSHEDQVFYRVWMLEAEVTNGGFWQYIFNSSGGHAITALDSLREIGAHEIAAICERFYALLPGGRPAPFQRQRQDQLEQMMDRLGDEGFDAACNELDNAFYALLDDLHLKLFAFIREDVLH